MSSSRYITHFMVPDAPVSTIRITATAGSSTVMNVSNAMARFVCTSKSSRPPTPAASAKPVRG